MLCGHEDRTSIFYASMIVLRCMAHKERLFHVHQNTRKILSRDVVEELLGDGKGATRQARVTSPVPLATKSPYE
jgi:hypothetical protein